VRLPKLGISQASLDCKIKHLDTRKNNDSVSLSNFQNFGTCRDSVTPISF
jgi:hypothetical protein